VLASLRRTGGVHSSGGAGNEGASSSRRGELASALWQARVLLQQVQGFNRLPEVRGVFEARVAHQYLDGFGGTQLSRLFLFRFGFGSDFEVVDLRQQLAGLLGACTRGLVVPANHSRTLLCK